MDQETKKRQVVCPKCGYRMPIFYTKDSTCSGVTVPCKGRGCSTIFELKIIKGVQIK